MIQVFNATLEDHEWRFNNQLYFFPKREVVFGNPGPKGARLPDEARQFINEQCWGMGLIVLEYGMDFKAAERKALEGYLKGVIFERLRNYEAMFDESKKKGVTLDVSDYPDYARAKRWKKEIKAKLNMEDEHRDELSFISDDDRKKLGITDERVKQFKEKKIDFDIAQAKVMEASEEGMVIKKKPGRKRKEVESFADTDIEADLGVEAVGA